MGGTRQTFHLLMIKPTHYNDEGYPIQWWKTIIPSNSLACVYGLARDCADRRVLGDDVDFDLYAVDETNTRVVPGRLIRRIQRSGGKALVALVGVQTNQFPRAVDLARPFLDAGIPVAIGGFHVSGCMAMLPEMPPEMKQAREMGISFFLGEAENGRFEEVIRDASAGELKPVYNYLDKLPDIPGEPIPFLSTEIVNRLSGRFSSFDIGRGCPFECSFCTIINVHGRKSRFRSADDLERIVRENHRHGINQFFVTDDNLARNKNWEELFDRLILLRERDGIRLRLMIQVDTLCHRIPGFIDKAVRAGADQVFVGMENINPDNLMSVKKRQNKITEYREMFLQWKKHPVLIIAGYIIGFPNDTKESIVRDVETIRNELPIDLIYFTNLTPLPGSEDHKKLHAAGVWMDPDLNNYDLNHRVTHHERMSDAEWDEAYRAAWETFYTWEHMERVLRRVYGCRSNKRRVTLNRLAWFRCFPRLMGVHPLEGGYMPLKFRRDRRPTFRRENPLVFYPKYAWEILHHNTMLWGTWAVLRTIRWRIERDPERFEYRDLALTPPNEAEFAELGLYATRGARETIERQRKHAALRKHAAAAEAAPGAAEPAAAEPATPAPAAAAEPPRVGVVAAE